MLSYNRAAELLRYEPESGLLTWRVARGNAVIPGSVAGHRTPNGYLHVTIDGKGYPAHRIAWLLTHGEFPRGMIDHINGVRSDNRIPNLRDVDTCANQQNKWKAQENNQAGFAGVRRTASGRYQARIKSGSQSHHLGMFDTAEQAHSAYLQAKGAHHPAYVPAVARMPAAAIASPPPPREPKGVYLPRGRTRWKAKIKISGRTIHLGSFATADEARAAYLAAKRSEAIR